MKHKSSVKPILDSEQITISTVLPEHCEKITNLYDKLETYLMSCDKLRIFNSNCIMDNLFKLKDDSIEIINGVIYNRLNVFEMTDKITGYHVILNVCFSYPDDIVYRMIKKLERYKRGAIIGVSGGYNLYPHGYRGIDPHSSLGKDLPVHELDISTLIYHTDRICISRSIFGKGDNPNKIFSIWAQTNKIPLIVMEKEKNEIQKDADLPKDLCNVFYTSTLTTPDTISWKLYSV